VRGRAAAKLQIRKKSVDGAVHGFPRGDKP
jgi:hypothetical protein